VQAETAAQHGQVYEEYQTEERLFNELRHEFNRFCGKMDVKDVTNESVVWCAKNAFRFPTDTFCFLA
jgi:hypothetical protein